MNSAELKKVKKACSITVKIFRALIKELGKRAFKTELDVYDFLKQRTKENGCKLAFKPVVAMGRNAAEIHHKASNSRLRKGFLVVDFGVKYKGYCGDCTRTFYLYGKPSKFERKIYELVLLAQETALMHVRAGAYAADIDLIARAILWDYYRNFVHGTGHGIGKKIHQSPGLSPTSKRILKKGQAITIEPGLYFKNKFGVRIEDTIVVGEKGARILTKISKKLLVV